VLTLGLECGILILLREEAGMAGSRQGVIDESIRRYRLRAARKKDVSLWKGRPLSSLFVVMRIKKDANSEQKALD